MIRLLTILLFLGSFNHGMACCSASQKRIFPVGIKDNKIIAVQIELFRNCDENFYNGDYANTSFVWGGSLRLMQQEKDSLVELEMIDSLFRFTECKCSITLRDSLSKYDSIVNFYYQKGLTRAKKLPGFEILKLESVIEIIDSDSLMIKWSEEDVIYLSKTKRNYNFYRDKNAYEPVYHIGELKTYRYKKKQVYVVMIDNNYYTPEDPSEKQKKIKPKTKIESDNYFSLYPEWHGNQVDFILFD